MKIDAYFYMSKALIELVSAWLAGRCKITSEGCSVGHVRLARQSSCTAQTSDMKIQLIIKERQSAAAQASRSHSYCDAYKAATQTRPSVTARQHASAVQQPQLAACAQLRQSLHTAEANRSASVDRPIIPPAPTPQQSAKREQPNARAFPTTRAPEVSTASTALPQTLPSSTDSFPRRQETFLAANELMNMAVDSRTEPYVQTKSVQANTNGKEQLVRASELDGSAEVQRKKAKEPRKAVKEKEGKEAMNNKMDVDATEPTRRSARLGKKRNATEVDMDPKVQTEVSGSNRHGAIDEYRKVLTTMRACLDEWCNDERFTIRHLKSLHQREGALEREIRACASEWRRTPSVIHRILLLLHRTMLSLSWKPAEDDTNWSILGRARVITAKFFTAYEIVGASCLLAALLWEVYKALKLTWTHIEIDICPLLNQDTVKNSMKIATASFRQEAGEKVEVITKYLEHARKMFDEKYPNTVRLNTVWKER
ncbi:hypothetical protein VTP01DRAFT_6004 [Rhizomucor pusillus]|uniref:uncharacterized protein n=1 Tax=Rhizomucor pusillus TaxID=4840 RepID=UPI003743092E